MLTVADLIAYKERRAGGERQLVELYVATPAEAAAAEAAGIDIVVTEYGDAESGRSKRETARDMRAAAPGTHFCFGLGLNTYPELRDTMRAAYDALNDGADSIYCPQSFDVVAALASEYVPVIGHTGLVPSRASWTGGFVAVGKTAVQAQRIYDDIRRYEDAGAIGAEVEVVPERVAAEISKRTSILTVSMGAGSGCDVQYLFATDVLGENEGHIPRHAKVYRDFKAENARLQQERIAAFGEYAADVTSGAFPTADQLVGISDDEFSAFMKGLDNA